MPLHRILPPPVVTAIAVGAMALIDRWVPALRVSVPFREAFAGGFAIAGAVLLTWSALSFFKARTTINPLRPERASALITSGPYRFSRNPIYLADLLIVIAGVIWFGNALNVLIPALFVAVITRFQIMPEEAALSAQFQHDFARYCTRVRRWL